MNREPSVGSDRYEDLIIETRKRSCSRGPGSRMGSRTSSQLDFRSSQSDFKSSSNTIGKLDLDYIKSSAKCIAALDLDSKVEGRKISESSFPPPRPQESPLSQVPEPRHKVSPTVVKPPSPVISREPLKAPTPVALDGNQNTMKPTLPTVPQAPKIARKPVEPDPLVKLFPQNIPHWFVITYTYSVVLMFILLVANVSPDGKLYI